MRRVSRRANQGIGRCPNYQEPPQPELASFWSWPTVDQRWLALDLLAVGLSTSCGAQKLGLWLLQSYCFFCEQEASVVRQEMCLARVVPIQHVPRIAAAHRFGFVSDAARCNG